MNTSTDIKNELNAQQFFHGTKANLKQRDIISAGFNSNYGKQNKAKYVYFAATMDATTWGAELALGEAHGRIYIVQPTGFF
ncbi:NAD(+)--rifampin ADP-ribosyltransferase [Mucilaginibacter sp. RB4R14]|nr:NAD(+)--rifampin ADP-ribosyltransferase [Mucilaginibacter aurantiaciroseus]